MTGPSKVVILVGHGGIPKDFPPQLVSELKREEAPSAPGRPTPRFSELDAKIRRWPRTPESDPYKPGLEAIAKALAERLAGHRVVVAYNEFCAPSLEEALEAAIASGAREVTVITTMYTRGGIHSESEVPQAIEQLRLQHPGVEVRYAWPFSLPAIGAFLAAEIERSEAAAASSR